MEEAEKIISVDQVSKVYRLYDKPIDRLLESISLRKKSYHKDFYALRDISFSVGRGEAVGIIGTNGSGKSTMLKIITVYSVPPRERWKVGEASAHFWSWAPALTRTIPALKISI